MSRDNTRSTSTTFEPRGRLAHLAEQFDRVPRYLFRTSAPSSSGITTKVSVVSNAAKNHYNQDDILGRDREEAREMLESHLLWKNLRNDNLMSWSSSFIWVAQHAIRRHATDFHNPSAKQIRIGILDTRKLPRGSLISAVALLEAYDVEDRGKLTHEYYYGEYLSQGKLELNRADAMMEISLQALMDYGLYEMYPPFGDEAERKKLWFRVNDLRGTFRRAPEVPSAAEIDYAEIIAEAWSSKEEIRPVVMMTLLSLKPRLRLDNWILEAFRKNRWGALVTDDSLDSYRTTSNIVPEHRQYLAMMHDVHADTERERQRPRTQEPNIGGRSVSNQSDAGLSTVMSSLSLNPSTNPSVASSPDHTPSRHPTGRGGRQQGPGTYLDRYK